MKKEIALSLHVVHAMTPVGFAQDINPDTVPEPQKNYSP
jgi:hypothetical protein